jgi:hypothetical protein
MSAKPDYVVNTLTRPTGAAAKGGYVINLTSSTTPMALSQPKDPTLAQYTFFVSRRLEDGRERFRLHMGYFESMQAAEEMLAVVREVYPSAWAGEAPGKNLRPNNATAPAAAAPAPRAATSSAAAFPPKAPVAPARAAAPAAAPAPVAAAPKPAAPPVPHPFAAIPPPPAKVEFEEPFVLSEDDTAFKPMDVPVVHPPVARPVVSPPAQAAAPKPAARPAAAKPAAKPVAKAAPAKPVAAQAPPKAAAKPAAPPKAAAPKPAAAPSKPAAAPVRPAAARPVPAKPPVVAPKIAAQVSAPALTASAPARPAAAVAPPVRAVAAAPKTPPADPTVQMPTMSATPSLTSVRQAIDELDDLTDTQTIRLLERHTPYREGSRDADVDEAIRVVKPEDTQSMMAIKQDVKRNAPVLFAVQLDWSVSAFDMGKVPPLAIFNAYTLYTTEATRDGRTWYGLRLGFFSDAVSAKQVAYYVRSDFKTVSVVPVTTIEKERATDLNASRSGVYRAANIRDVAPPTPESISASNSGVFKLLEDDTPAQIEQDVDGEMSPRFFKATPDKAPAKPADAATPAAPEQSKAAAAAKSRKPPSSKGVRRDAHAQVDEETLDQTLEILGANSLEITNDSSGDTGVRHLRVKIDKKGSKFASLIDRLSGKK